MSMCVRSADWGGGRRPCFRPQYSSFRGNRRLGTVSLEGDKGLKGSNSLSTYDTSLIDSWAPHLWNISTDILQSVRLRRRLFLISTHSNDRGRVSPDAHLSWYLSTKNMRATFTAACGNFQYQCIGTFNKPRAFLHGHIANHHSDQCLPLAFRGVLHWCFSICRVGYRQAWSDTTQVRCRAPIHDFMLIVRRHHIEPNFAQIVFNLYHSINRYGKRSASAKARKSYRELMFVAKRSGRLSFTISSGFGTQYHPSKLSVGFGMVSR